VPYLAAGSIHPVIDRTFPLEQEALDAARSGKLGKLLLELR
jgi:NADPH:quinone reductase-like Zn-dependent oxidoreductase